jgi:hypothetical protein
MAKDSFVGSQTYTNDFGSLVWLPALFLRLNALRHLFSARPFTPDASSTNRSRRSRIRLLVAIR